MHSFDLSRIEMAQGYEDYLEPVLALCLSANATEGIAHMTVDEKIIEAGMSQRRPKPHVDGCFMPVSSSGLPNWSHEGGGVWSHEGAGGGGWAHYCNDIRVGPVRRMPVIVASSVAGCRAWRGVFEGEPKSDGDLSHLELGEGEVLPANHGYLLSPDCVHESMIFDKPTQRSFLRIALPVTYQYESHRPD